MWPDLMPPQIQQQQQQLQQPLTPQQTACNMDIEPNTPLPPPMFTTRIPPSTTTPVPPMPPPPLIAQPAPHPPHSAPQQQPQPSLPPAQNTAFGQYSCVQTQYPPPPSPSYHLVPRHMSPRELIAEFEKIMRDENDKIVFGNAVCLLFRFSLNTDPYNREVCREISNSREIINSIFNVLRYNTFQDTDILGYCTGNLTNISRYDEGKAVILNTFGSSETQPGIQSLGVESLIKSLQSQNKNVVIFATTALHNLLLDRRPDLQELAKEQIKDGLEHIVRLLYAPEELKQNYEFKCIVLDCLQMLAFRNSANRLTINKSNGPYLILQTIRDNLDNQAAEELLITACRLLKSLSTCSTNKKSIIEYNGIDTLLECIQGNNIEILKDCLWTLRNLSDLLSQYKDHICCLDRLSKRIIGILNEYRLKPLSVRFSDGIVTCALGVFANLTCNNSRIKELVCYDGVECLIKVVGDAYENDMRDYSIIEREILEPSILALCHLTNMNYHGPPEDDPKHFVRKWTDSQMFILMQHRDNKSEDLNKAISKLLSNVIYPHLFPLNASTSRNIYS